VVTGCTVNEYLAIRLEKAMTATLSLVDVTGRRDKELKSSSADVAWLGRAATLDEGVAALFTEVAF
jgi:hypothetical protein